MDSTSINAQGDLVPQALAHSPVTASSPSDVAPPSTHSSPMKASSSVGVSEGEPLFSVLHTEQHRTERSYMLAVVVRLSPAGEALVGTRRNHSALGRLLLTWGGAPLAVRPSDVPHSILQDLGALATSGTCIRLLADVQRSTATARGDSTLSVEMQRDGEVLHRVIYGTFDSRNGAVLLQIPTPSMSPQTVKHQLGSQSPVIDTNVGSTVLGKRSPSDYDELSPTDSSVKSSPHSPPANPLGRPATPPPPMQGEFTEQQTTECPTNKQSDMLIRTSQIRFRSRGNHEQAKVHLRLNRALEDMMLDWSEGESFYQRRLVQFWRRQKGQEIQLSFRAIHPDQYIEGTNVVSCIYFEKRKEYYITSVDLIALLESLIGIKFVTAEKNRIRRNLEGFKPETMSRLKSDVKCQEFFFLIMGLDTPRPRHIEKDIKVFKWTLVHQAMLKVLGKYSYVASRDLLANANAMDNEPGGGSDDDDEISADEESEEEILVKAKNKKRKTASRKVVGARRPRRSNASSSRVKAEKPTSPVTVVPKIEQQSPTSSHHAPLLGTDDPSAPPHSSTSSGSQSSADVASPMVARGSRPSRGLQIHGLHQNRPTTNPQIHTQLPLDHHSAHGLIDSTAVHLEDRDSDDAVTQIASSPIGYAGASGELDGIDGRSFQHVLRRQAERESQNSAAPSAPLVAAPNFLAQAHRNLPPPPLIHSAPAYQYSHHHPNHSPPSQHFHHYNYQHHPGSSAPRPVPHLPPQLSPAGDPALSSPNLGEPYMPHQNPIPDSQEIPYLHESAYANVDADLTYPSSSNIPDPSASGILDPSNHPSTYIKSDSEWDDDDDPNAFILRASEQGQEARAAHAHQVQLEAALGHNHSFNDPRYSYAAASRQHWGRLPESDQLYHYSYEVQ